MLKVIIIYINVYYKQRYKIKEVNNLEFVMNKIISIDKDAETYRQGIEKLLIEKEMELEKNINELRQEWTMEEKKIREDIMNEKLGVAEEKAKSISKEKEESIESIKNKYAETSNQIVNEVFLKIINSL
jgi:F0F1-type ATP synthase membrane subunit b/b'